MRKAGRSAGYFFGLWCGIALICAFSSRPGYLVYQHFPTEVAATTALAAGAILAMLADKMIPETFEEAHNFAGMTIGCGFLCSFLLSKIG